ncbi:SCO family protein [Soonwooa sp.]|uniref:SCO family protein n=1 Tax=Soonwooa sp. TaxID=1938592 RepID=UPI002605F779|nr:SCO family protein [Soonwooa sp.]
MKNSIKIIVFAFLSLMIFNSCQEKSSENLDPNSIFNLSSKWEQPDGSIIKLEDLKGKVLTMVMVYTSCKTACPRLTLDMKAIEEKVGHKNPDDLRYVFISIDPEHDTPEKMQEFLKTYQLDGKQWVFIRSSEANTRELANVLAMKYKQISPMDFSHSNIISVFSKDGLLVHQKEGINIDIDNTVNAIKNELK